MIILTGANTEIAKTDDGGFYKNFSFKEVITDTKKIADKYGYKTVIYDLGELGIGKLFRVEDESFSTKGYYENELKNGYKSKSLFKPAMVKACIDEYGEFTAYLDGDAMLCGRIDDVDSGDYDIGVTLRDPKEIEDEWHQEHFEIVKYVNAGVIFFNPTDVTKKFIDSWILETDKVGNDQMALNNLVCPDYYPEVNSIITINGTRIKFFPGKKYNYYYFNDGWEKDIRIMHFKGVVRRYYPFTWGKRAYCALIMPVRSGLSSFAKRMKS